MKKANLQLETLACPMCAQKIESALQRANGVSSARVLYNASKAKVEYDEGVTDAEELRKVVKKLGYDIIKVS